MKTLIQTTLAALALVTAPLAAAQSSEVVVLCSQQAAWCNMMQTVFARTTGIQVRMSVRSAGEALAQLSAERANPKTDLWFGGTGDPHLLAAQQDLTAAYRSSLLPELHEWARKQAERSGFKTVGIYSGPLGWGVNTELLAKKKLAMPKTWADLLKPEYKNEVQVANPASSGTAYTMVATLVQLMGEDKAFAYLAQLHRNVSAYPRSGAGPIKAAARGEATIGIVFTPDVATERAGGFAVETVTPLDGTGAEIGSMSIVKGARNLDNAKRFYDWALSAKGQQFGPAANYFGVPSNRAAGGDPRMPDFKSLRLIDYDYAKYGSAEERKRLIARWEKDVNALPR